MASRLSEDDEEELDWDHHEAIALAQLGDAAQQHTSAAEVRAGHSSDDEMELDLDALEAQAINQVGGEARDFAAEAAPVSPNEARPPERMEIEDAGDSARDGDMHVDSPRVSHNFVGRPVGRFRMSRFGGEELHAPDSAVLASSSSMASRQGQQDAPGMPTPRRPPVAASGGRGEEGASSAPASALRAVRRMDFSRAAAQGQAQPETRSTSGRSATSDRMHPVWSEGPQDDNVWLPVAMDREYTGECTPVRDSVLPEDRLASSAPYDLDGFVALVPHTYFAFSSAEHLYVTLAHADVYCGTRHLSKILEVRKRLHPGAGYLTLVNDSTLRVVFVETECLTRQQWIDAFRRHGKTVTPCTSSPHVICGQKGMQMTQNAFFKVCDELVQDEMNEWTGFLLVER